MPDEIAAVLFCIPTIAHKVYLHNVNIHGTAHTEMKVISLRYLFSTQGTRTRLSSFFKSSAFFQEFRCDGRTARLSLKTCRAGHLTTKFGELACRKGHHPDSFGLNQGTPTTAANSRSHTTVRCNAM
jgi:hypothetical protein